MILPRLRSGPPKRPVNPIWRLSGLGIELASPLLAGMLIGWLLDKWFGTKPTLLIVFSIAGLVVGMVDFIRSALRAQRDAAINASRQHSKNASPSTDLSSTDTDINPPADDHAPPQS